MHVLKRSLAEIKRVEGSILVNLKAWSGGEVEIPDEEAPKILKDILDEGGNSAVVDVTLCAVEKDDLIFRNWRRL